MGAKRRLPRNLNSHPEPPSSSSPKPRKFGYCPTHRTVERCLPNGFLDCSEAWAVLHREEREAAALPGASITSRYDSGDVTRERRQAWDNYPAKSEALGLALGFPRDQWPQIGKIVSSFVRRMPTDDPNRTFDQEDLESSIWAELFDLTNKARATLTVTLQILRKRAEFAYLDFYQRFTRARRLSTAAYGSALDLDEVSSNVGLKMATKPGGEHGDIVVWDADGAILGRKVASDLPTYDQTSASIGNGDVGNDTGFACDASAGQSMEERIVDEINALDVLFQLPDKVRDIVRKRSRLDQFEEQVVTVSDRKVLNRFVTAGPVNLMGDLGCPDYGISQNSYLIRAALAGGNHGPLDWHKPKRV